MNRALAARIDRSIATLDLWRGSSSGATWAWFVPGRIEVLGKHTDYAGGRSLVSATEQGLCVVARPREDRRWRMADLTREMEIDFEISADLEPPGDHWSNYPQTVARRLVTNFPPGLQGADVAFTSDLPRAAGMSSSSALVIAVFLVLSKVNRLPERQEYLGAIRSKEELGEYLGSVENGLGFAALAGEAGVGTFGGSEDQTAILCSRQGELQQYSYSPVTHERSLSLPESLRFVVAVSGVRASKTGAARGSYNRVSLLASTAAELWRRSKEVDDPHLGAVLRSGSGAEEELRSILRSTPSSRFTADELLDRCEQFRLESTEILPAAGDALAAADLEAFGEMVDRSQLAAERLLGNQIDETMALARTARQLGAVAASAFGAGFGGSVWALVDQTDARRFRDRWREAYRRQFPRHREGSMFLLTGAAAGARQLDLGAIWRDR